VQSRFTYADEPTRFVPPSAAGEFAYNVDRYRGLWAIVDEAVGEAWFLGRRLSATRRGLSRRPAPLLRAVPLAVSNGDHGDRRREYSHVNDFYLVAEEVDNFLELLAIMRLEMVTEPSSPKAELRKSNGQIG